MFKYNLRNVLCGICCAAMVMCGGVSGMDGRYIKGSGKDEITSKAALAEKYTMSFWNTLPLHSKIPTLTENKQASLYFSQKDEEYLAFCCKKDWVNALKACVSLADVGYETHQAKASFLLIHKSDNIAAKLIGIKYLIASFYNNDANGVRRALLEVIENKELKEEFYNNHEQKDMIFSDAFAYRLLPAYLKEFSNLE
ncbi:MAG: hypothetical protein LBB25_02930 [Holosporaceae bacterium]|jgi:hypothetical protein|nr:hypothetical protein [Holosporaceae bacterium]